ncbi:MAG: transcriptional repressor LexA [Gemmatales bacterium]|nr:transcriptional repressor LexA [Gemmatales bacterium]MDW8385462.1 transcriptional repressor LexA [Gemmatales bacterium]
MPNLTTINTTLTKRQKEIYQFIKEKIESRGYGPTVREIGAHFGIKSPNGVMCHLKALEKKGFIQRQGFSARAIQLVGYRPGQLAIPLLGRVAAGFPTLAVQTTDEYLDLHAMFLGDNRYALKVRGNSMIEDHIQDGDYVIIEKQETARNGERVVAMVDGEVTLKRFFKERNRIRLEPANGNYAPIFVEPGEDIRILGTLIGVIRKV